MSAHTTNTPLVGAMHHTGFFNWIMEMVAVHKQRRDLAKLDDRALRDIGVSRYQAEVEASRPAWDVPHHWLG